MDRLLGLKDRRRLNGFLASIIGVFIFGIVLIYGSDAFLDSHALFFGIADADETNMLIFNNSDAAFRLNGGAVLTDSSGQEVTLSFDNPDVAIEVNPSRADGMPTEMYKADKSLLGNLSARIGETVYVRPTMNFIMAGEGYEQEPIKTILLAVYHGIEIGKSDEIISVGAVLLAKDMNSYVENPIYVYSSNPPIIPEPITRYSYKFSDPHKIYIDQQDAYKKLLGIYEKRLKTRLQKTEQHSIKMEDDRVGIERAIERMKNKIK